MLNNDELWILDQVQSEAVHTYIQYRGTNK